MTEPRASRCLRLLGSPLAALLTASLALTPLAVPRRAGAAEKAAGPSAKEMEAARKAFGEGMQLEAAEKWSEAREKFEEVSRVRMSPQVRFHIALCEEHEGKLVEALRDFALAESEAKADKVPTVVKEAPEHEAAIKPRVPKLKVVLPDLAPHEAADAEGKSSTSTSTETAAGAKDAKEITVTLDDLPIDATGADAMDLDPGQHVVAATAEGRVPFKQTVTLAEGDSKTVNVKLPLIPKPEEEAPPPPPPPPEPGPRRAMTAYVVGGAGVVALLGAGGFYLVRSHKKSDLDSVCHDLQCPPDKSGEISSGRTFNTLANVFGIVGVVGVGAGVVLYMTAPRDPGAASSDTRASIRLLPSAPGADLAGLSLAGAF